MTIITIKTNDKKKAEAITLLLKSVEGLSITVNDDPSDFIPPDITPQNPKANPHKLAGIWKDADISSAAVAVESIRKKAWRN